MDRITLDRETFKALASDTRLDILKKLDERQKTVTELSRELDLNKATVFEHLEKLEAVGLVQKLEDERKWVYWQLTWKGRRLLHPEAITLALVLSTAFASLLAAGAAAWLWWRSNVSPLLSGTRNPAATPTAGDASGAQPFAAEKAAPPIDAAPSVAHDPVLMWAMIAFGALCLVLVVAAFVVRQRARKAAAASA